MVDIYFHPDRKDNLPKKVWLLYEPGSKTRQTLNGTKMLG